jgi:putative ABC transport system permease protein
VYPELTRPLIILLAAGLAWMLYVAIRHGAERRLSIRQVTRRRTEAMLVIAGSLLGTTLIVGSLVVGDTLRFSVKQVAYDVLGPIDERVTSPNPARGDEVAARLEPLRSDPDIDGVETVRVTQMTATHKVGRITYTEPQALAWSGDLTRLEHFGAAGGSSGMTGPSPTGRQIVVNEALAESLHATVGDTITTYLFGAPRQSVVTRIVRNRGVAGIGLGASQNSNAFFPAGALETAAIAARSDIQPATITLVSNRGGVERGAELTDVVKAKITAALGPLTKQGVDVTTAKDELLKAADEAGDSFGSLFLFIASFSIIAGILLLVNIFVMLSEERKSQLGMLRAIGMKRNRLVAGFAIEGGVYAIVASLVGVVAGIGVGRGVVSIAGRIFNGWDQGNGMRMAFSVTPTSLVNGFCLGLIIAFTTIVITAIRISRLNIIAAIRDLPPSASTLHRRRLVILSTAAAVLFALLSVPALTSSDPVGTYLMPALALVCLVPLALRHLPRHLVTTGVALLVLLWGLTANLFRPDIFDEASMAVYIVEGVMITFSAVVLVTDNQAFVLRPLRRWMQRPSESGLAARLATAYPIARRFRTGATLIMYALVMFVLVLLTEISAIIGSSVDKSVKDATAGYALRLDVNPATPIVEPERTLPQGEYASRVASVAPLLTANANATDPLARRDEPLPVLAIGIPQKLVQGEFPLDKRLDRFAADRDVWDEVLFGERYVIVDASYGMSGGGPGQEMVEPGQRITVIDPSTGVRSDKTIAGIIKNPQAFYGIGPEARWPVLMGERAVKHQFGTQAQPASLLVQAAPGVDEAALGRDLESRYLTSGVVATRIHDAVKENFSATQSFFTLMQGFLALGLLVGITGLGVVMVRAVRERRRTIGVLRALGFRASTVERSFLTESSFVAVEGIVIGATLGVISTYLLFQNSAAFTGLDTAFPIAWKAIAILVVTTFLVSFLFTLGPARRAARIRPAVAVRVAD